ncbi:MAG: amino acid ABC transporter permease [Clostridia bacterium]|nr:amino acid ABC transporter permease [Clostridia bacterium]
MSPTQLINTLKILSQGLGITISLFFIVIFLSIPLGLVLTFMSNSKLGIRTRRGAEIYPLRWLARGFVFLMRGTPLMLQLLFVYFGLPYIGIVLERFPAACVAFVLNYAAYFCEIFRGGIKSIDPGQYEAAQVLGLRKFATTIKIVLPQMIRVAIPSVCNETVNLIKDTALVTTLGLADLMHMTKSLVNSLANVTPFAVAAVIYMVLIFGLSKIFSILEKKTTY